MRVSLDDIAREAQVSKSTVSRVINNFKNIDPQTREKVLNILKKRNYNVNRLAKHLSQGKGLDVIGVIGGIYDLLGRYYYVEFIRQMEKYLEEKDHALFIFNVIGDQKSEQFRKKIDVLCDYYHSRIVKGYIMLAPIENDLKIEYLSKKGVKGIAIGSRLDDENFGYVDVDSKEGAKKIVTYLIDRGHQKIALINGYLGLSSAKEREAAFYEVMKQYKLPIRKEYVTCGFYSREGGRDAAHKLLTLKDPPTAIFAANDDMAVGVYEAAQTLNLKIPEDISLVGFDNNLEVLAGRKPLLTTMGQPYAMMGEMAAFYLEREEFSVKSILSPVLIERDSVKNIK